MADALTSIRARWIIKPQPIAQHKFRVMDDTKPEGPYLCSCGRVCWDAEEGLHHLTEVGESR